MTIPREIQIPLSVTLCSASHLGNGSRMFIIKAAWWEQRKQICSPSNRNISGSSLLLLAPCTPRSSFTLDTPGLLNSSETASKTCSWTKAFARRGSAAGNSPEILRAELDDFPKGSPQHSLKADRNRSREDNLSSDLNWNRQKDQYSPERSKQERPCGTTAAGLSADK